MLKASSILTQYIHELYVKRTIFAALGGALHTQSMIIPDYLQWSLSVDNNITRTNSDQIFLAPINSLSNSTSLGRIGNLTQDTLSLYLSVWLMEPYVDTNSIQIIVDEMTYELGIPDR